MHGMTAAHQTLPFGTVIEVRHLGNKQKVRVTITDRGPFVGRRILDLSYAAAHALGMVQEGVARVELRVLVPGDGARRPPVVLAGSPRQAATFSVQVGAFQDRRRADELARKLSRRYPEVRVEEVPPWYRVRLGAYADRRRAERVRSRLEAQGYPALVVSAP
jgi:rare lipoprotein A